MNLSFEDSEEGYSMKKYISAFLSLIMIISGAAVCFAEETAVGVMANGGKSISQPLKWGQHRMRSRNPRIRINLF